MIPAELDHAMGRTAVVILERVVTRRLERLGTRPTLDRVAGAAFDLALDLCDAAAALNGEDR